LVQGLRRALYACTHNLIDGCQIGSIAEAAGDSRDKGTEGVLSLSPSLPLSLCVSISRNIERNEEIEAPIVVDSRY